MSRLIDDFHEEGAGLVDTLSCAASTEKGGLLAECLGALPTHSSPLFVDFVCASIISRRAKATSSSSSPCRQQLTIVVL